MNLKAFLLTIIFFSIAGSLMSQKTDRAIHKVIIFKRVNENNTIINSFIQIDSTGRIFKEGNKTDHSFDITRFTKEVNTYIVEEKIDKYPANNFPPLEAPTPELNRQATIISVWFQDDVDKEKSFANKTHYIWGKPLDKSDYSYLLFKYLSADEIEILRKLLN